jgi:DNA-binding MarR family transcriptional regulator
MAAPRWLSELEMRAWIGFLNASASLNRRLDQELRDGAGLSHLQYEVLVRLAGTPGGRLRMTELADVLLHSKSGLTYQVTQLDKAGLVRRESLPGDERAVVAVLTNLGRGRLEETAPGHVAMVRELFIDVLTPEQIAALADGLTEVVRRLDEHRSPRAANYQRARRIGSDKAARLHPVGCSSVGSEADATACSDSANDGGLLGG